MKTISNLKPKYLPYSLKPHHIPVLFPTSRWIETEKRWISIAKQDTEDWLDDRKGKIPIKLLTEDLNTEGTVNTRLTGSVFSAAAGRSPFTTADDLALEIVGLKKKEFSEKSKKNMLHGKLTEPVARKWYEKKHNVKVKEIGLVVPKWNFHLGASVDGIVEGSEGIIEIKCPVKMYQRLIDYNTLRETGWTPRTPYYHSHIWESHYAQMQGGMAILDKDWCDYIVYSTSDKQIYQERVLFNEKYWNEILYPLLQKFLNEKLFSVAEDIITKT